MPQLLGTFHLDKPNSQKPVELSRENGTTFLCISQFQLRPAPHPPGYCGAFAHLVSPGGGAFANVALPGGRAFANPELLTRTRFPINITTQRILPEKQAHWLICQGREKIEEVCKGMFSILCMHFFIAYQARITWRNLGAIGLNHRFFGY